MSTNIEEDKPTTEASSSVSPEIDNTQLLSASVNSNSITTTISDQASIVEKQQTSSSWLNSFGLSPNLTNQLTNLSSSFMEVTSKVSAAANTLVQRTLPQRPSSPNENEQADAATKTEDNKKIDESAEEKSDAAGTNKDLTSM